MSDFLFYNPLILYMVEMNTDDIVFLYDLKRKKMGIRVSERIFSERNLLKKQKNGGGV